MNGAAARRSGRDGPLELPAGRGGGARRDAATRLDRRSAITLFRRAVALAVNHIDNAGYYCPVQANEFIKAVLHWPHLALRSDPLANNWAPRRCESGRAWLLDHVPVVLLIPGTPSLAHLEESILTASVHLRPGHVAQMEAFGSPVPGPTPI